MPHLLLRRRHPSLFVNYHGVIVAALGTGICSALADRSTPPPPILLSFYTWLPIHIWGYIYVAVGVVLVVGLFYSNAARLGLVFMLSLLFIRLGFQLWQAYDIWREGASPSELLPIVAGLPILYAFVASVASMAMEPFSNPDSDPDMPVFRIPNGRGNGHE